MEKIRSAIAKARSERDAISAGQPAPRSVASRDNAPTVPDVISAHWAKLPQSTFNANLMRRNRIVAHQRGSEGTTIDMMRTRVLQQMRDNNWRRLAITSPTAACGKSTIALNLGVSLQRQADLRTLLLEMDLRRPSLMRMLGQRPTAMTFADVLRGNADFADVGVCYGGNLTIGASTGKSRDAAELLASGGIREVLAGIETHYQPNLTIFDMPPMLAADDMMAFATQVDCVLIVAAAERTTTKEIDLCEQELARQTNVMGVVLNECRYVGPEANYGYYG
ncbi:Chromosome partitioning ATPase, Mrp family, contains Fe-S cluster [Loktanella atrilutea]|uniref:Chromosome partitioning ATPase, Mrp family, contains Fe-S cluster n=1 Tax=Loktanella atrilutea TaxID=366533 RepID=A0A1M5G5T3_LOKAT|nr:CpsD/CapB family tyrosine-protein kinase [Loktanella atrilutea]SHF99093.1 Chromosome partitioning ATPase, Mrp family, contains Fe-S cluster [Loktanella atrilutea]